MKKQKRQKYSNGSSVKQKTHQNVQAIEKEFAANQKGNTFGRGSTQLPGGVTVNYSIFKNRDDKIKTTGIDKTFGKTRLGASTNKYQDSISIGRGGLSFNVTKPKNGKTSYGITYRKKI